MFIIYFGYKKIDSKLNLRESVLNKRKIFSIKYVFLNNFSKFLKHSISFSFCFNFTYCKSLYLFLLFTLKKIFRNENRARDKVESRYSQVKESLGYNRWIALTFRQQLRFRLHIRVEDDYAVQSGKE